LKGSESEIREEMGNIQLHCGQIRNIFKYLYVVKTGGLNMTDRTLYLFDTIDKATVKAVVENIIKINKLDDDIDKREKDYKRLPIEIIINSRGGSIYDGLALINVIEKSKTDVHTYVYGLAASMALLIAVSGHKRFSGRLSTFMYHSVSNNIGGKLDHLKNRLDEMQRLQNIYDQYLLSKTKFGLDQLKNSQDHQHDWFISTDEALELGIIDMII
jgi:ATP-dependent Clp protease protease subunit